MEVTKGRCFDMRPTDECYTISLSLKVPLSKQEFLYFNIIKDRYGMETIDRILEDAVTDAIISKYIENLIDCKNWLWGTAKPPPTVLSVGFLTVGEAHVLCRPTGRYRTQKGKNEKYVLFTVFFSDLR